MEVLGEQAAAAELAGEAPVVDPVLVQVSELAVVQVLGPAVDPVSIQVVGLVLNLGKDPRRGGGQSREPPSSFQILVYIDR